jgi:hypothetical protein
MFGAKMYQPFDWTLYLDLAKHLLVGQQPKTNNNIDEAYYRSAISRAYYAAYCVARNYLQEDQGLNIPVFDSHKFVLEEFMDEPKIASTLKSLRDDRNRADYNNQSSRNLAKIAQQSTEKSEYVIDLINKL